MSSDQTQVFVLFKYTCLLYVCCVLESCCTHDDKIIVRATTHVVARWAPCVGGLLGAVEAGVRVGGSRRALGGERGGTTASGAKHFRATKHGILSNTYVKQM